MTKTIGKNRAKLIDAIFGGVTSCRCFSLSNNFTATDCDVNYARKELEDGHRTRLISKGDGKYSVQVHSNLWYDFESAIK